MGECVLCCECLLCVLVVLNFVLLIMYLESLFVLGKCDEIVCVIVDY